MVWNSRPLQDTVRILDLLNNIGNCYFELGRFNEALIYFSEQRVLAVAASRKANLAAAQRNLAMVAAEQGDPGIALALVDSALELMTGANSRPEDRAIAWGNKGNYLLRLSRSAEARSALERAVAFSKEQDGTKNRSFVLTDLGDLALREGRCEQSDSLIRAALTDAGRHLRARSVALRMLSTLRKREGRWEEAQELLAAHIAARDSFINERATDQLARAEMRQKYRAHEQEEKIDDLGDRIAQERRLRNLVLAITLLAILLAGLALRNWRFQRKIRLQGEELHGHAVAQLMRQQEIRALDAVMKGQEIERSRIARDLHDRVGSLLSAVKMQFGPLEGRIEKVQATAGEQYKRVTDLLDTAVGEVRRISHDLEHGNLASFGLGYGVGRPSERGACARQARSGTEHIRIDRPAGQTVGGGGLPHGAGSREQRAQTRKG